MHRTARPKEVVAHLKQNGFVFVRQRGSHVYYKHIDGRWTTVPMHNRDLPIGTLRGIFKRADLPFENF